MAEARGGNQLEQLIKAAGDGVLLNRNKAKADESFYQMQFKQAMETAHLTAKQRADQAMAKLRANQQIIQDKTAQQAAQQHIKQAEERAKQEAANKPDPSAGPKAAAGSVSKTEQKTFRPQNPLSTSNVDAGGELLVGTVQDTVSGGRGAQQVGPVGQGGQGTPVPEAPAFTVDRTRQTGQDFFKTGGGTAIGFPTSQTRTSIKENALTPGQVLQAKISEQSRLDQLAHLDKKELAANIDAMGAAVGFKYSTLMKQGRVADAFELLRENPTHAERLYELKVQEAADTRRLINAKIDSARADIRASDADANYKNQQTYLLNQQILAALGTADSPMSDGGARISPVGTWATGFGTGVAGLKNLAAGNGNEQQAKLFQSVVGREWNTNGELIETNARTSTEIAWDQNKTALFFYDASDKGLLDELPIVGSGKKNNRTFAVSVQQVASYLQRVRDSGGQDTEAIAALDEIPGFYHSFDAHGVLRFDIDLNHDSITNDVNKNSAQRLDAFFDDIKRGNPRLQGEILSGTNTASLKDAAEYNEAWAGQVSSAKFGSEIATGLLEDYKAIERAERRYLQTGGNMTQGEYSKLLDRKKKVKAELRELGWRPWQDKAKDLVTGFGESLKAPSKSDRDLKRLGIK